MRLIQGAGEKPLWSQLYDIIEADILNKVYKQGDLIPSEKELVEKYEVSRVTVRKALDRLFVKGLVSRERGIGTVVIRNDNLISTSLQSSYLGVKENNDNQERKLVKLEYALPPAEIRDFFGITVSMKCIFMIRQHLVDNLVVTHSESYLNPKIHCTVEDFKGSLYDMLEEKGYRVDAVNEVISAHVATEKEHDYFQLEESFAVIERKRKAFSKGFPVEYNASKYLANDYELKINLL